MTCPSVSRPSHGVFGRERFNRWPSSPMGRCSLMFHGNALPACLFLTRREYGIIYREGRLEGRLLRHAQDTKHQDPHSAASGIPAARGPLLKEVNNLLAIAISGFPALGGEGRGLGEEREGRRDKRMSKSWRVRVPVPLCLSNHADGRPRGGDPGMRGCRICPREIEKQYWAR